MTLNPADWATIAAGESGNDIEPSTELFSRNFDVTGGQVQKSWPQGKFLMAFHMLVNSPHSGQPVTNAAKQAFIDFLANNPDVLKTYLSMKNPGFMARNMRQWMRSWEQQHPVNTMNASPGGTQISLGGA
jgi:hypothetical protein